MIFTTKAQRYEEDKKGAIDSGQMQGNLLKDTSAFYQTMDEEALLCALVSLWFISCYSKEVRQ